MDVSEGSGGCARLVQSAGAVFRTPRVMAWLMIGSVMRSLRMVFAVGRVFVVWPFMVRSLVMPSAVAWPFLTRPCVRMSVQS